MCMYYLDTANTVKNDLNLDSCHLGQIYFMDLKVILWLLKMTLASQYNKYYNGGNNEHSK